VADGGSADGAARAVVAGDGPMTAAPILRVVGLRKAFGDFTALHGVDLAVREGEFLTIVGPSGGGKSTLIRLLVGMEEPTAGEIWLRGSRIERVPANKRPTCMVFQSLALFPHRSVGQNIEFPLKIRGVDPAARRARALELLELLRLPAHYHDKRIQQCSGGERQRVALARALAYDPEILFFDEPLSALDYRLRKTLEKELKDLHERTGKTFVYITHSLEEAMVMSDRIAIMRAGRFEQIATPDDIYARPKSRFVAEFMGEVNLFEVRAEGEALAAPGVAFAPGAAARLGLPPGGRGVLVVRPESMRFLAPGEAAADAAVEGTLRAEYALGSRHQYEIERPGGGRLTVETLREGRIDAAHGAAVRLGWDLARCHLIREDGDGAR
jgi:spermidine/putrescine transport system ATP-binding protein